MSIFIRRSTPIPEENDFNEIIEEIISDIITIQTNADSQNTDTIHELYNDIITRRFRERDFKVPSLIKATDKQWKNRVVLIFYLNKYRNTIPLPRTRNIEDRTYTAEQLRQLPEPSEGEKNNIISEDIVPHLQEINLYHEYKELIGKGIEPKNISGFTSAIFNKNKKWDKAIFKPFNNLITRAFHNRGFKVPPSLDTREIESAEHAMLRNIITHYNTHAINNVVNNQPIMQQTGVAFDIHRYFKKFKPKINKYLEIINQPDNSISPVFFYRYLKNNFENNIIKLFPGDDQKVSELHEVFDKANKKIKELNEDERNLMIKSVDFAFSQGDDFKKEYIIVFLDETCHAYSTGTDTRSCVAGIIERFVTAIGSTVKIICTEKDNCNDTYDQLNMLLNPKFSIPDTASEWFKLAENNETLRAMNEPQRKKNFIDYLKLEAKRIDGVLDKDVKEDIKKYADDIDYAFEELQIGGSKKSTRKMRKRKTRMKKTRRLFI
jgi:hypothetical protein